MTAKKPQKPGFHARQVAANVLKSVLSGSGFEPINENQMADGRDRALVNKLVTTALKRHEHLSHVLKESLSKGMPPRAGLFEAALRIALVELLFLDDQSDHSAIFLGVEVVRSDKRARRFDKVANGVLRQAQRAADKWQQLPVAELFGSSLVARWDAAKIDIAFDNHLEAWGSQLLAPVPLDISVKQDAASWAERLGGDVLNDQTVRITQRDRAVTELDGFGDGDWWVQDIAAALPAQLIDKPAGARVLDLCAAPGGKTSQLVNRGFDVTAIDADAKRMERVKKNMERMQFSADLVVEDVLAFAPDEKFDAILLDAPCSATGTFRRHPEVLLNRNEDDIYALVRLQAKMIDHALTLLKPDGVLVYCTCSLERAEGEAQAMRALERNSNLVIDELPAGTFANVADAVTKSGYLRLHPALGVGNHVGMDGFFAVRFKFA